MTDAAAQQLTDREREIVQLIAEGQTPRQIVEALGIKENTVETHQRHIMAKLGLRGVAELTRWAIREGITAVV